MTHHRFRLRAVVEAARIETQSLADYALEGIVPIARVERRLAAIMAADIVAYSRLVERDEARTLAAIRALRAKVLDPLIADHKGRIVKRMGDGAIVEFGSVVDAVASAVAARVSWLTRALFRPTTAIAK